MLLPVAAALAMGAAGALPAAALGQGTVPASTGASSTTSTSSTTTPGSPPAPVGLQPKPKLPADRILSNESTFTTWTISTDNVAIRAQPSPHARGLARLRSLTSDGFLQSYILLREHFTSAGAWVQLRIPGRPNGRTGWVPRWALDSFAVTHMQIVVNRALRSLTLYRNGRRVLSFPVGVGKPSTPTPPGHFWITESFFSTDPFYGPWAFATSDYSVLTEWPGGGIVGLHGTNEPSLIPGDPSHGCIRLLNSDVVRLIRLVHIGTPLLVI